MIITVVAVLFLLLAALILWGLKVYKENTEILNLTPNVNDALLELGLLNSDDRRFLKEEASRYKEKYAPLQSEILRVSTSKWGISRIIKKSGIVSFLEAYSNIDIDVIKNNELRDKVEFIDENFDKYLKELDSFISDNHYFSYTECFDLKNDIKEFRCAVKQLVQEKKLGLLADEKNVLSFYERTSDLDVIRQKHNNLFVERELQNRKDFFDKALAYPLDIQQRQSIVKLEDNCLVIASAGSGKTSTMMGKIKYLVSCRKEKPEDILTITYTRKASEELSGRMNNSGLKCLTFHKLAMEIIAKTTGRMPSIAEANLFVKVFYKKLEESSFKSSVVKYLLDYQCCMTESIEYDTVEQYVQDRKKYGNQALFSDMDGKFIFTKSEEEKKIVSYLTKLGVRFRYEEVYPYKVYDDKYRQYKPDFTIYYEDSNHKNQVVYLEHFGVDKFGNVPKWFGNGTIHGYNRANAVYKESMRWKKNLHYEKGTQLVFTTSGDFHLGIVEARLEEMLRSAGVPIHKKNDDELYNLIMRRSRSLEKSVLNMCQSFISLMKANDCTIENALKKAQSEGSDRNIFVIEKLMTPLYESYQQELLRRGEQDFTDVILEATEICSLGRWKNYRHILVDEFQDLSMDRYRFLSALRNGDGTKPAKLYCVGDDWQSIYRFSGSDMALFSRFSDYFGYTEECRIETTYRFGYPLIGVSSDFVMKNPMQKRKNVNPRMVKNPQFEYWQKNEAVGKEDAPSEMVPLVKTDIEFKKYSDDVMVYSDIAEIVEQLPKDKNIYILGRYSYDVLVLGDCIEENHNTGDIYIKFQDRKVRYLTVHSSKGLEADYVFLLNCNAGVYGFPSQVADDPVLNYVLSQNDTYDFAEERRVFYVGITRAKIKTYVMYHQKKPSVFVSELIDSEGDNVDACPICKCGHKVVVKAGCASNGTPYRVIGCSNSNYGCTYYERQFDN
ncbi:MAG: UvrD-helicase domain-containing protein [Paludibacteraceae bacterium]|nr:UvrD-helicase domain-containing protein [Paludibacteraceae bacterium]